MQKSSMSFIKGMGAGMVAGAAAFAAGKYALKNSHNVQKGSAKLIKAVGDVVDGVQTMFK